MHLFIINNNSVNIVYIPININKNVYKLYNMKIFENNKDLELLMHLNQSSPIHDLYYIILYSSLL